MKRAKKKATSAGRAPSRARRTGTVVAGARKSKSSPKQRTLAIGARVDVKELRDAGGVSWGERSGEVGTRRWVSGAGLYGGAFRSTDPRDKSARARVTAAELATIESAAKQARMTVATYLRACALYVAARLDGDATR